MHQRHDLSGIKDNLNTLTMRQKNMENHNNNNNNVNQGMTSIRQPFMQQPQLFARMNPWGVQPQAHRQLSLLSSFPQIQPLHNDKTARNALDDEADDDDNDDNIDGARNSDDDEDDDIVSSYRRQINYGNVGGTPYATAPIAFQPTTYAYPPPTATGYDYSYANKNIKK